ncbi:hypothetical protein E4U57_001616 [Claviceps arundinis]|uniref:Alpha/beta hydrolase fold-3 domain-containing protein n=1 Tax=Claviceps arundinis TaxID=1623583 RepID=A0A9P7MQA7_9HYPO|nr:hypothetical protein E4U56_001567 [Claviceps arundinis]KAG5966913.1 hypothetical protein E4U57_001616 [Claviceps arundinis]
MADFSRFGVVSDEWLAAEKTWTPPVLSQGLSFVELRKVMNKEREEASAQDMEAFKDLVRMQDHSIATRDGSVIEARSYRPVSAVDKDRLPVFLYLHGGGFLTGSLDTDDATCSQICTRASVVVLHVNYRHTPEHVYPTAWDDAEDGFAWLHQNIGLLGGHPDKVIVGGVSAGAQLTASLVLGKNMGKVLSEYPAIAGQVLMIPCLVHLDAYESQLARLKDPALSSYKQCQDAPILPAKFVRVFFDLLQSVTPDPSDLRMSPGNASVKHVRGMPPTTFGVAGVDPLRDEALLYSELLAEAGVPTDTYVFEGVPHAFSRFPQLSQTKRWDAVLCRSVQWSLSRPKPGASVVKTERP